MSRNIKYAALIESLDYRPGSAKAELHAGLHYFATSLDLMPDERGQIAASAARGEALDAVMASGAALQAGGNNPAFAAAKAGHKHALGNHDYTRAQANNAAEFTQLARELAIAVEPVRKRKKYFVDRYLSVGFAQNLPTKNFMTYLLYAAHIAKTVHYPDSAVKQDYDKQVAAFEKKQQDVFGAMAYFELSRRGTTLGDIQTEVEAMQEFKGLPTHKKERDVVESLERQADQKERDAKRDKAIALMHGWKNHLNQHPVVSNEGAAEPTNFTYVLRLLVATEIFYGRGEVGLEFLQSFGFDAGFPGIGEEDPDCYAKLKAILDGMVAEYHQAQVNEAFNANAVDVDFKEYQTKSVTPEDAETSMVEKYLQRYEDAKTKYKARTSENSKECTQIVNKACAQYRKALELFYNHENEYRSPEEVGLYLEDGQVEALEGRVTNITSNVKRQEILLQWAYEQLNIFAAKHNQVDNGAYKDHSKDPQVRAAYDDWMLRMTGVWSDSQSSPLFDYVQSAINYKDTFTEDKYILFGEPLRKKPRLLICYRLAVLQELQGYIPRQFVATAEKYGVERDAGLSGAASTLRKGEVAKALKALKEAGVDVAPDEVARKELKKYLDSVRALADLHEEQGEYTSMPMSLLCIRSVELGYLQREVDAKIKAGCIISNDESTSVVAVLKAEFKQISAAMARSLVNVLDDQRKDRREHGKSHYSPYDKVVTLGPGSKVYTERSEITATLEEGEAIPLGNPKNKRLVAQEIKYKSTAVPPSANEYLTKLRTNALASLEKSEPMVSNALCSKNILMKSDVEASHLKVMINRLILSPIDLSEMTNNALAGFRGRFNLEFGDRYTEPNGRYAEPGDRDMQRLPLLYCQYMDAGCFVPFTKDMVDIQNRLQRPEGNAACSSAGVATLEEGLRSYLSTIPVEDLKTYNGFSVEYLADLLRVSFYSCDVETANIAMDADGMKFYLAVDVLGAGEDWKAAWNGKVLSPRCKGTERAIELKRILDEAQSEIAQHPVNHQLLQNLNELIEVKYASSKKHIQGMAETYEIVLKNEYQSCLQGEGRILDAGRYNELLRCLGGLDRELYDSYVNGEEHSTVKYFGHMLGLQHIAHTDDALPALEAVDAVDVGFLGKLEENCLDILNTQDEPLSSQVEALDLQDTALASQFNETRDRAVKRKITSERKQIADTIKAINEERKPVTEKIEAVILMSNLMLGDAAVYAGFTEEGPCKDKFETWLTSVDDANTAFRNFEGGSYYQLARAIELVFSRGEHDSEKAYFKGSFVPNILQSVIPAGSPLQRIFDSEDYVTAKKEELQTFLSHALDTFSDCVFNINRAPSDLSPLVAAGELNGFAMSDYEQCEKALVWIEKLSRKDHYKELLTNEPGKSELSEFFEKFSTYIQANNVPPNMASLIFKVCSTFMAMDVGGQSIASAFDSAVMGSIEDNILGNADAGIEGLNFDVITIDNPNVQLIKMIATPERKEKFIKRYLDRARKEADFNPGLSFVKVILALLEDCNDKSFLTDWVDFDRLPDQDSDQDPEVAERLYETVEFIVANDADSILINYPQWNAANITANKTWGKMQEHILKGEAFDVITCNVEAYKALATQSAFDQDATKALYNQKLAKRMQEQPAKWFGCEQQIGVIAGRPVQQDNLEKWIKSVCLYPASQVAYSGDTRAACDALNAALKEYLKSNGNRLSQTSGLTALGSLQRVFGWDESKRGFTEEALNAFSALKQQIQECAARGDWNGRENLILLGKKILGRENGILGLLMADNATDLTPDQKQKIEKMLIDETFLVACEKAHYYNTTEVLTGSDTGSDTGSNAGGGARADDASGDLRIGKLKSFLNTNDRKARFQDLSDKLIKRELLRYKHYLISDSELVKIRKKIQVNRENYKKLSGKRTIRNSYTAKKKASLGELNKEHTEFQSEYTEMCGTLSLTTAQVKKVCENPKTMRLAEIRETARANRKEYEKSESKKTVRRSYTVKKKERLTQLNQEYGAMITAYPTQCGTPSPTEAQVKKVFENPDDMSMNFGKCYNADPYDFEAGKAEEKSLIEATVKTKQELQVFLTMLATYERKIFELLKSSSNDLSDVQQARKMLGDLKQIEISTGLTLEVLFKSLSENPLVDQRVRNVTRELEMLDRVITGAESHVTQAVNATGEQRDERLKNAPLEKRAERLLDDLLHYESGGLLIEDEVLAYLILADADEREPVFQALDALYTTNRIDVAPAKLKRVDVAPAKLKQVLDVVREMLGEAVKQPDYQGALRLAPLQESLAVVKDYHDNVYLKAKVAANKIKARLIPVESPTATIIRTGLQDGINELHASIAATQAEADIEAAVTMVPETYRHHVTQGHSEALVKDIDAAGKRVVNALLQDRLTAQSLKAWIQVEERKYNAILTRKSNQLTELLASEASKGEITVAQAAGAQLSLNNANRSQRGEIDDVLLEQLLSEGMLLPHIKTLLKGYALREIEVKNLYEQLREQNIASKELESYQEEQQLDGLIDACVKEGKLVSEQEVHQVIAELYKESTVGGHMQLDDAGVVLFDKRYMFVKQVNAVSDGLFDASLDVLAERSKNIEIITYMRAALGCDFVSKDKVQQSLEALSQLTTEGIHSYYLKDDRAVLLNAMLSQLSEMREIVRGGDALDVSMQELQKEDYRDLLQQKKKALLEQNKKDLIAQKTSALLADGLGPEALKAQLEAYKQRDLPKLSHDYSISESLNVLLEGNMQDALRDGTDAYEKLDAFFQKYSDSRGDSSFSQGVTMVNQRTVLEPKPENETAIKTISLANKFLKIKEHYHKRLTTHAAVGDDVFIRDLTLFDKFLPVQLHWFLRGRITGEVAKEKMLEHLIKALDEDLLSKADVARVVEKIVSSLEQQELREVIPEMVGYLHELGESKSEIEAALFYCQSVIDPLNTDIVKWLNDVINAVIGRENSTKLQNLPAIKHVPEDSHLLIEFGERKTLIQELECLKGMQEKIDLPPDSEAEPLPPHVRRRLQSIPDSITGGLWAILDALERDDCLDVAKALAPRSDDDQALSRDLDEAVIALGKEVKKLAVAPEVEQEAPAADPVAAEPVIPEPVPAPAPEVPAADLVVAVAAALTGAAAPPAYDIKSDFIEPLEEQIRFINAAYSERFKKSLDFDQTNVDIDGNSTSLVDSCVFSSFKAFEALPADQKQRSSEPMSFEIWMDSDRAHLRSAGGVFSTMLKKKGDESRQGKLMVSIYLQAKMRIVCGKLKSCETAGVVDKEALIAITDMKSVLEQAFNYIKKGQHREVIGSNVGFYGTYHRTVLYPLINALKPLVEQRKRDCQAKDIAVAEDAESIASSSYRNRSESRVSVGSGGSLFSRISSSFYSASVPGSPERRRLSGRPQYASTPKPGAGSSGGAASESPSPESSRAGAPALPAAAAAESRALGGAPRVPRSMSWMNPAMAGIRRSQNWSESIFGGATALRCLEAARTFVLGAGDDDVVTYDDGVAPAAPAPTSPDVATNSSVSTNPASTFVVRGTGGDATPAYDGVAAPAATSLDVAAPAPAPAPAPVAPAATSLDVATNPAGMFVGEVGGGAAPAIRERRVPAPFGVTGSVT